MLFGGGRVEDRKKPQRRNKKMRFEKRDRKCVVEVPAWLLQAVDKQRSAYKSKRLGTAGWAIVREPRADVVSRLLADGRCDP